MIVKKDFIAQLARTLQDLLLSVQLENSVQQHQLLLKHVQEVLIRMKLTLLNAKNVQLVTSVQLVLFNILQTFVQQVITALKVALQQLLAQLDSTILLTQELH